MLSPDQCNPQEIRTLVEQLSVLLSEGEWDEIMCRGRDLTWYQSAWQALRVHPTTHDQTVQEEEAVRINLALTEHAERSEASVRERRGWLFFGRS